MDPQVIVIVLLMLIAFLLLRPADGFRGRDVGHPIFSTDNSSGGLFGVGARSIPLSGVRTGENRNLMSPIPTAL